MWALLTSDTSSNIPEIAAAQTLWRNVTSKARPSFATIYYFDHNGNEVDLFPRFENSLTWEGVHEIVDDLAEPRRSTLLLLLMGLLIIRTRGQVRRTYLKALASYPQLVYTGLQKRNMMTSYYDRIDQAANDDDEDDEDGFGFNFF